MKFHVGQRIRLFMFLDTSAAVELTTTESCCDDRGTPVFRYACGHAEPLTIRDVRLDPDASQQQQYAVDNPAGRLTCRDQPTVATYSITSRLQTNFNNVSLQS